MIDTGRGAPLVLIPGIQGRWEWMAPAVDALSASRRVLSFSLDEAEAESTTTFDGWLSYIDRLLDRAGLDGAAVVGVSFGGLIAAHYAARRPDRVRALILVSAPPPRWTLGRRQIAYVRHPLLSAPSFALRACLRLLPEVIASNNTWPARLAFLIRHLGRIVRYPPSPSNMAAWVHRWKAVDDAIAADCARIAAPTLIVTGEPHLDRVVPPAATLEYLTLISGARHVVLTGTGHIGLVAKPEAFARIVGEFIDTVCI